LAGYTLFYSDSDDSAADLAIRSAHLDQVGLAGTVVFIGWSLLAYRASSIAQVASQSDSAVTIEHVDGIWSFLPRGNDAAQRPALIVSPDALVSPVAYAPLVRAVAIGGFQAAAQLASTQPAGFSGLILIGTTHPRDVDLRSLTAPVTKIVGTRDGIAKPQDVEANRAKLPAPTHWVWVEGGNHSQFGWYGFQPGDRPASMPADGQHARRRPAYDHDSRGAQRLGARQGNCASQLTTLQLTADLLNCSACAATLT
jgi:pimeloyl-ACP methyl ester carboxylesterase